MVLFAAIDIHKHAFQAAVLDPDSGQVVEERFSADGRAWPAGRAWRGRVGVVAIEATTGWRWVWRELVARGFEVRLAEPLQARALLGRRRSAKTDRLDARWLARLVAKEMLPESWIPPEEVQQLRDRTRLHKALAEDVAVEVSACTPACCTRAGPAQSEPAPAAGGVDIVRFDDDGVGREHWGVFDAMGMMQQLGVIPSGPPA